MLHCVPRTDGESCTYCHEIFPYSALQNSACEVLLVTYLVLNIYGKEVPRVKCELDKRIQVGHIIFNHGKLKGDDDRW